MKIKKANKHLSITQISMYLRCPLQYKFRYIDGFKIPPKSAITFGKAVHGTIEYNYRQKIKTQKDEKLSILQDYFCESFELLSQETLWEKDEKPQDLKDEGAKKIVPLYRKKVSPKIYPKLIEEPFEVIFDKGFDWTFKGYIDLVDVNNNIIDHKITQKTPSEIPPHDNLQLTAYALGYRYKFLETELGLRLDYMVRTKTPKVVQLNTAKSQKDIDRFLKLVGYVAKAIEEKMFYPQPFNILCNERACGYKELCDKDK